MIKKNCVIYVLENLERYSSRFRSVRDGMVIALRSGCPASFFVYNSERVEYLIDPFKCAWSSSFGRRLQNEIVDVDMERSKLMGPKETKKKEYFNTPRKRFGRWLEQMRIRNADFSFNVLFRSHATSPCHDRELLRGL